MIRKNVFRYTPTAYDNNIVEIHNIKRKLNNESTVFMTKVPTIHKAIKYFRSNLVNK